jgi:hypothetical protein
MLATMTSYLEVGIALFLVTVATYICIHPNFDLQDGVLHKGFDIDGHHAFARVARRDSLTTDRAVLMSETSSPHVVNSADCLALMCVQTLFIPDPGSSVGQRSVTASPVTGCD